MKRPKLRTLLPIWGWICLTSVHCFFYAPRSLGAAQTSEKTFPVSANPNLILNSQSGWITIKSWQKPEIRVVYTRYSSNVEVDFEHTSGKVRVATHVLDSLAEGNSIKVDYQIFTPEEANLEIRTTLGGVIVERIRGEVRIDVVNAVVKVMGVTGFINARSLGSKLEISESRGTIQTSTVSGDIFFSRLGSNSVTAQSTIGNIQFDGAFVPRGRYQFSTNEGTIQIHCSDQDSVEWDAKTHRGVIESDLPILSKDHHYAPHSLVGRQSLVGTLNAGEATVQLSTFTGKISISKK
jgi:DUF4097 and DUF4098 domain-containing protein YvlB